MYLKTSIEKAISNQLLFWKCYEALVNKSVFLVAENPPRKASSSLILMEFLFFDIQKACVGAILRYQGDAIMGASMLEKAVSDPESKSLAIFRRLQLYMNLGISNL